MQIDEITGVETHKQSFEDEHIIDSTSSFGTWLCLLITTQMTLTIQKLNTEDVDDPGEVPTKAINFLKEEKFLRICSIIDEFTQENLVESVQRVMDLKTKKIMKKDISVGIFIDSLYTVMKYFSESITLSHIESAVYNFILNLCLKEHYDYACKLIDISKICLILVIYRGTSLKSIM